MMETVKDYQRDETSKRVYQFYNFKEYDEDEVEVEKRVW